MDDYDQGTTSGDIFDSDDEEYSRKEESNSSQESSVTEDSCEEESSENVDPWEELIHEAATELRTEYQRLVENFQGDGFSDVDAKKQAFSEIGTCLCKSFGVDSRNEKRSHSSEDYGNQKKVRQRRLF